MEHTLYQIPLVDIHGKTTSLAAFRGQVLLIVNTASKCGFTPQYQELEQLYQELGKRGFTILGFPCNQFGAQEQGNEAEISQFCQLNYGVSFPMFAKIEVNGPQAHPLYQQLKQQAPGVFGTQGIKWNFTKFLLDRQGKVISRFSPTTKPLTLRNQIIKLLE